MNLESVNLASMNSASVNLASVNLAPMNLESMNLASVNLAVRSRSSFGLQDSFWKLTLLTGVKYVFMLPAIGSWNCKTSFVVCSRSSVGPHSSFWKLTLLTGVNAVPLYRGTELQNMFCGLWACLS